MAPSVYTRAYDEEVVIPVVFENGGGSPQAAAPGPMPTVPHARLGEIIVRFKEGASGAMAAQALGRAGLRAANSRGMAGGAQLVTVAPDADLAATLAKWRQDPGVAYAEPNYELRALAVPNDPRYGEQWGMAEVQASQAWDRASTTLSNSNTSAALVTVAVIDTGVDAAHEDLPGRVLPGHNAISGAADPNNAADDMPSSHGTHVAGVIAAVYNNSIGVAGVTGGLPVSILPVKVLDSAGVGTMYDVAQGIRWAADQGARVINLSLGARLPDYPQTLADAVRYAQDRGALVVAAAGNDGCRITDDCGGTFYPAALPGVVSVGATGGDHHPAAFSNPGATLSAPGVDILSTVRGNGYGLMSGTSMAAPFASGAAALLRSAYPNKSTSEVGEALWRGMRNFPENLYCPPSGYSCYYQSYYYVLNADGALSWLGGGSAPVDSIQFIQPHPRGTMADPAPHVAGTVYLTAEASNPANVGRVVFTLDPNSADPTVLGKVYGPAGGGSDAGGLFTIPWDTTSVADGPYSLKVNLYDGAGVGLNSGWLDVTVANNFLTGLSLKVLKPDGTAAAGAAVTVYHAVYKADQGEVVYETAWEGAADQQGRVIIPGATATDGNDFFVTARGSEPNFLYYRTVRAPAQVTLDAADAQQVAFSGRRTDGQALGAATITADLLEANLPAPADPGRVIARVPLATLNAAGTAAAYLTRGRYNLRLVSAADTYYLVQRDLEVTASTTQVDFHPQAGDTATLSLAPVGAASARGLSLTDEDDGYAALAGVNAGATATVTSGRYSVVIDAVYQDAAAGKEWLWTLRTPAFQAAAGENRSLPFGEPAPATLAFEICDDGSRDSCAPGRMAFFRAEFPDAHGNLTTALKTQAYSPAATAATDVPPVLEILDSARNLISDTGRPSWTGEYWLGSWYIPAAQPAGDYTARVILDAGPLGRAESQATFTVAGSAPAPAAPDLTVRVLDRTGAAMAYARVALLQRAGGAYYPAASEQWTDAQGDAPFDVTLDPQGTYALAIYGSSPVPTTATSEPVFLFVPLGSVAAPASVTVDTSGYAMERIVLQANDGGGPINWGYVDYTAWGYDASGNPGGMYLENPDDSDGLALWVPRGRYAFQADVNDWNDRYHLTRVANVAAGGGTFNLGGADLSTVSVAGPPAPDAGVPEYGVGGVALFSDGLPASPAFRGGQPVTVTPGTYQAQAVLVRQHYDGEWDYWLEWKITAAAGDTVAWAVYGDFTTSLSLDAADYSRGDTVQTTHRIEDSAGNRLVAINTGMGLAVSSLGTGTAVAPPAVTAWRVPGAGPLLTGAAGATGAGGPVRGQDHDRIAPFLVIRDPSGAEVYRYKDAGPDFDNLGRWASGFYGESYAAAAGVAPVAGPSTFFGGRWTIPQDTVGGTYTAALELGAGPEGTIHDEKTFSVNGAPWLEALASPTNAPAVTVTGLAAPGAAVTVYVYRSGVPTEAVSVMATADGRFSLSVALPDEGSYDFTATATANGETSPPSAPVTVVVDRTPPGPPSGLTGEGQDETHILLTWTAPADTDVVAYRIYRNDAFVETVDAGVLSYLDEGLQVGTDYDYQVFAVDRAGNASLPARVTARTSTTGDLVPPSAPANPRATAGSGGIANLAWDAATDNIGVAGYHIWRATGDGPAAVVGAVYGADKVTFRDIGLAAETEYTYTVTAFDAAGNESGLSDPAIATTPALSITSVFWRAPRIGSGGPVLMGVTVSIVLRGEPNRQAVAEVVYQTWTGEAGTLQSTLREIHMSVTLMPDAITPGSYRGSFTLASGTAELTSITGMLEDGAGHATSRQAPGLPLAVAGALRVQVIAPPDTNALNGAQLVAWSEATGSGGSATLNGPGVYALTGLAPAADYRVRILDRDGRLMVQQSGVAVTAGRETALSLTPRLPAELRVRVLDPDGSPVSGVGVIFHNTTTGESSYWLRSASDGWTRAWRFEAEDEVRVTVAGLPLPYSAETSRILTLLLPGHNGVDVVLERFPQGTLTGQATNSAGDLVAGVVVTATQRIDGRPFTRSVVTDVYGLYSMTLMAGQARVSAAEPLGRYVMDETALVDVPAGGVATLPLPLDTLGPGTVTAAIYTRQIVGAWQGPMDIDWRVAVHFRLSVTDARGGQYNGWSYPVRLRGVRPGETVRVCVDGVEAGLPADCQTVQLDEQRHATAEFRLERRGARIQGRVVTASGQPVAWHYYQVYFVDSSGQRQLFMTHKSVIRGNRLDIPVPGGGSWTTPGGQATSVARYQLQVSAAVGGDMLYGQAAVDVKDGVDADIDNVTVYPCGVFCGWEVNGLTAVPGEVARGGVVTFRAAYYAGVPAADARLRLEVPAGASLVPDSVSLNGQPVVARVYGAVYEVALGDVTSRRNGVVRYQVRLDDPLGQPSIGATARIRYRGSSGEAVEEVLGSARVWVAGVTLVAPRRLTQPGVYLSGRAPAGSTVRVYDGNALLWETQASPGGFWHLAVTLPDAGSPRWYRLRAQAETGAETLRSPEATVFYDPDQVQLMEVSMRQWDGRRVTFDPSAGVARFPYVLVPGAPFYFELRFNDPTAVGDVEVRIGDARAMASQDAGGVYRAAVYPAREMGPVYVRYKTRPGAGAFNRPAPTEAQLRLRMPWPASDFVVQAVNQPGGASSQALQAQAGGTGSVLFSLPNRPGLNGRVDLTARRGVSYTPTADDLAREQASGVPVYGFSFNHTTSANEMVIDVAGYIPERVLDSADTGAAAAYLLGALAAGTAPAGGRPGGGRGGGEVRAAGVEVVVQVGARVTFRVGGNEALNAADWADTLNDGFGVPDKFKQLEGLLNGATNCGPMASTYRDWIDSIGNRVMAQEATKWGLMIAGTLLAPATFGLGTLLLFGASQAVEAAMDASIDRQIQNVKDNMAADPFCEDEDEDDPNDPAAEPTWIYDPSGYVYEAVYDNRVEGVTATALQSGGDGNGPWSVWDAAWFGQENPQVTDPQGRYGWDVPEGWWQVVYEKDGYEPASSESMYVPPPRTEVNVGMVALDPPAVTAVTPVTGASGDTFIDITFDKYMLATTLTDATVTVAVYGGDGDPLAGTVTPIQPVTGADGRSVTRTVRFTPDTPFTVGGAYLVTVNRMVQSYAERPMTADHVAKVVIPAADTTEPAISDQAPAAGGSVNYTRPAISASVADASGIDAAAITLRLDGAVVAHAFNAATGAVSYTPEVGLAEGAHTVSLSVYDRGGNRVEAPWSFTVDTVAPALTVAAVPPTAMAPGDMAITVTSDEPLGAAPVVSVYPLAGEPQVITMTPSGANAWAGTYPVGARTAAASYVVSATGSDPAGNAGSGSLRVAVNRVTASLTVDNVSGTFGTNVTLKATLSPAAAWKTIAFRVDGAPVGTGTTDGNGMATLVNAVRKPAGTYTIAASFGGDDTITEATGSGTLMVAKAAGSLTVDNVSGTYGSSVTLKATLSPAEAGKTIAFTVGDTSVGSATTNASGVATLPYTIGKPAGTYTIAASFGGDDTITEATGTGTLKVTSSGGGGSGSRNEDDKDKEHPLTDEVISQIRFNGPPATAIISKDSGGSLRLESGTRVEIPGGALPEEATLRVREGTFATPVQPTSGAVRLGNAVVEVSVVGSASGQAIHNFSKDITVEIPFNPADFTGSGSASLRPMYWDTSRGVWVPILTGVTVDTRQNRVSISLGHLTTFTVGELKPFFEDVTAAHWSWEYVSTLRMLDAVSGYPGDGFQPEQAVTRAEMARMLVSAVYGKQVTAGSTPGFGDVAADHWARGYIRQARALGIVKGYEDGTFRPEAAVTRAEAVRMLLAALKVKPPAAGAAGKFADVAGGHWAAGYVAAAVERALVGGYPDNTFRPDGLMTRAEAAKIIALAAGR